MVAASSLATQEGYTSLRNRERRSGRHRRKGLSLLRRTKQEINIEQLETTTWKNAWAFRSGSYRLGTAETRVRPPEYYATIHATSQTQRIWIEKRKHRALTIFVMKISAEKGPPLKFVFIQISRPSVGVNVCVFRSPFSGALSKHMRRNTS